MTALTAANHSGLPLPVDGLTLEAASARWSDAVVLMDTSIPHIVTGDWFRLAVFNDQLHATCRAVDPWRQQMIDQTMREFGGQGARFRTDAELDTMHYVLNARQWSMSARWDNRLGVWIRHTEDVASGPRRTARKDWPTVDNCPDLDADKNDVWLRYAGKAFDFGTHKYQDRGQRDRVDATARGVAIHREVERLFKQRLEALEQARSLSGAAIIIDGNY